MADPVPTDAPPDVKPGWMTSEFWLHLLVGGVLVYFLQAVLSALPTSGLPPLVVGGLTFIIPIVLGFLTKNYTDARVDLKTAASMVADASAAGKAAPTGAVLNQ